MAEFLLSASYNGTTPADFLYNQHSGDGSPFQALDDQGGGTYKWSSGMSAVEAVITVRAALVENGALADLFILTSTSDSSAINTTGRDTITDFSTKEGDRVYLKGIDADSATPSDDAFNFIGTGSFNRVPGELRYEIEGAKTYIYADDDGNGIADFSILIDASVPLNAADFIL